MEQDLTEASVEQIAQFYQVSTHPWLRANMVISKDGHFADASGSSRGLSSPLDLKILLTLRAISDAVLVGASTIRTEDYRPIRLANDYTKLRKSPAQLVIISRSLAFNPDLRIFSDPEILPIFLTAQDSSVGWNQNLNRLSEQFEVKVLPAPLDLREVITFLNSQGFSQIVCEGGPDLLGQLLHFDLVDELDITQSPISLGTPAERSIIHEAIDLWPNRITAKLGSHRVIRIKR